MAEEESQEPEGGKKKGGKKKLIMIVLVLLILLGGGGGAAFFLLGGSGDDEGAEGDKKAKAEEGVPYEANPMVDIDSFIVNILDEEGTHYLKASITLELDSPLTLDEVTKRMPQIRDNILLMVGNKTFRELADLEGKLQLRAELVSSLNQILETGEIKKIYFTDFVVQ